MCWHGVGSLVKLEGRLDSTAYQQVLEEHMLTDAAALIGDNVVFQQDNAPIHTSRSTRQWLRQHDVTLLDWPPKSPDANPIENLWHELKTAANRREPRTALSSGMLYKRRGSRACPELGRKCSATFGRNQKGERREHSVLRNW